MGVAEAQAINPKPFKGFMIRAFVQTSGFVEKGSINTAACPNHTRLFLEVAKDQCRAGSNLKTCTDKGRTVPGLFMGAYTGL